jgi:hypothetical protein
MLQLALQLNARSSNSADFEHFRILSGSCVYVRVLTTSVRVASLENRQGLTALVSSNLTLSARKGSMSRVRRAKL